MSDKTMKILFSNPPWWTQKKSASNKMMLAKGVRAIQDGHLRSFVNLVLTKDISMIIRLSLTFSRPQRHI